MIGARSANRGSTVRPRGHDVVQLLHRVPHVDVAHVQRREAEAADVGGTEVAHHPALDQRAHDPVPVRVTERHLRAASRGVARRGKLEAHARAALLDELDEQLGQRDRLGAHRRHVHLEPEVDGRLERGELEDVRRPGDHRGEPGGGPERGLERERLGVAEPARHGVAQGVVQTGAHVQERRRAGAAVEVLVPAPHRHVGAVAR